MLKIKIDLYLHCEKADDEVQVLNFEASSQFYIK